MGIEARAVAYFPFCFACFALLCRPVTVLSGQQGGALSPVLYLVYTDGLLVKVPDAGVGCFWCFFVGALPMLTLNVTLSLLNYRLVESKIKLRLPEKCTKSCFYSPCLRRMIAH